MTYERALLRGPAQRHDLGLLVRYPLHPARRHAVAVPVARRGGAAEPRVVELARFGDQVTEQAREYVSQREHLDHGAAWRHRKRVDHAGAVWRDEYVGVGHEASLVDGRELLEVQLLCLSGVVWSTPSNKRR